MAFLESVHIVSEVSNSTNLLNGQQITYSFLPDQSSSTVSGNPCYYVPQFNFKKAHIAGSANRAADFLSRLELKITEKILLKMREVVQTTPIQVTTSSSDFADKENIFFTQPVGEDETEEKPLKVRKNLGKMQKIG